MHKTKRLERTLHLRTQTIRVLNPGHIAVAAGGQCSTDTWTEHAGKVTSAACHLSDGCTQ